VLFELLLSLKAEIDVPQISTIAFPLLYSRC
jgi:hypothetical protein